MFEIGDRVQLTRDLSGYEYAPLKPHKDDIGTIKSSSLLGYRVAFDGYRNFTNTDELWLTFSSEIKPYTGDEMAVKGIFRVGNRVVLKDDLIGYGYQDRVPEAGTVGTVTEVLEGAVKVSYDGYEQPSYDDDDRGNWYTYNREIELVEGPVLVKTAQLVERSSAKVSEVIAVDDRVLRVFQYVEVMLIIEPSIYLVRSLIDNNYFVYYAYDHKVKVLEHK